MADVDFGRHAYLLEPEPAPVRTPAPSNALAAFLADAERRSALSRQERLLIVDQAIVLLEMTYVHLPMKRAVHAVDPVQELRRYRFYLAECPEHCLGSSLAFHRRMLQVFGSLRDLHTVYTLPRPYKDCTAYLPFLVEQCVGPDQTEQFIVTRMVMKGEVSTPLEGEGLFEPGVELLHWNGVPIRRVIELNGEQQAGSNPDAQFARGLDNLTIRPLGTSPPPDEDWIDLEFRTASGHVGTHRTRWLVDKATSAAVTSALSKASSQERISVDIKRTRVCAMKKKLYGGPAQSLIGSIDDSLYAVARQVDGRELAYIRLFSFEVTDHDRFVRQVARLITKPAFPQDGLILDVRGNPGGNIRAAESLLQLFTPRRIQPETFEFINTPLNYELCRSAPENWNLQRWVPSMRDAVLTGAAYSAGLPLTLDESCNRLGQVYYGPVVLITDALSYSATDMFAAGFQDNEVGVVLGTNANTGAGGANVWMLEDLRRAQAKGRGPAFRRLPKGVDMCVAVRRSSRVGANAGVLLEEFGVEPDRVHHMTREDILGQNDALVAEAASIIRSRPMWTLSVEPLVVAAGRAIAVRATSTMPRGSKALPMARVEVYADGRLRRSIDARDGAVRTTRVALGKALAAKRSVAVEVHALDADGRRVAYRRLNV